MNSNNIHWKPIHCTDLVSGQHVKIIDHCDDTVTFGIFDRVTPLGIFVNEGGIELYLSRQATEIFISHIIDQSEIVDLITTLVDL